MDATTGIQLTSRKSKVTTEDPPVITRPALNPEVVTSIESQTLQDSHVYVHCHFTTAGEEMMLRIWSTTFLIDHPSGARSTLVHAENISMAPEWTRIAPHTSYTFLLIFSALPKSCQRFDFKEEIRQPGGFHVPDISRNDTDVYHIDL